MLSPPPPVSVGFGGQGGLGHPLFGKGIGARNSPPLDVLASPFGKGEEPRGHRPREGVRSWRLGGSFQPLHPLSHAAASLQPWVTAPAGGGGPGEVARSERRFSPSSSPLSPPLPLPPNSPQASTPKRGNCSGTGRGGPGGRRRGLNGGVPPRPCGVASAKPV